MSSENGKHYRIINLKSQKGSKLNNQLCQLLQSQLNDFRLNVRLLNSEDPTIYRIKMQNLQLADGQSKKESVHSNFEEQKKAHMFLQKHKYQIPDIDEGLTDAWFKETHHKKCFIRDQTIAFLSKNDFDREMKHKDPWMIDYIYTVPKIRRKGKAVQLLKQIKGKLETSAICSSSDSVKLFSKANFHKGIIQPLPGQVTVMRYP